MSRPTGRAPPNPAPRRQVRRRRSDPGTSPLRLLPEGGDPRGTCTRPSRAGRGIRQSATAASRRMSARTASGIGGGQVLRAYVRVGSRADHFELRHPEHAGHHGPREVDPLHAVERRTALRAEQDAAADLDVIAGDPKRVEPPRRDAEGSRSGSAGRRARRAGREGRGCGRRCNRSDRRSPPSSPISPGGISGASDRMDQVQQAITKIRHDDADDDDQEQAATQQRRQGVKPCHSRALGERTNARGGGPSGGGGCGAAGGRRDADGSAAGDAFGACGGDADGAAADPAGRVDRS